MVPLGMVSGDFGASGAGVGGAAALAAGDGAALGARGGAGLAGLDGADAESEGVSESGDDDWAAAIPATKRRQIAIARILI
jgi:hypothetical protein